MKNINQSKQKINKYKKNAPFVYDFALVCIHDHYTIKNVSSKKLAYDIFIDLASDGFGSDVSLPCYKTFCNWINEICSTEKLPLRNNVSALKVKRLKSSSSKLVDV